MKQLLYRLIGRAREFADVEPLISLFIGGALLAVFLTVLFKSRSQSTVAPNGLLWTLYSKFSLLIWAVFLVTLLASGLSTLRSYLHNTVSKFQHDHGRVTSANYNAVQTIWGPEQTQAELRMDLYYEEEVTERIESENVVKPAVLRKKVVRHDNSTNPFISARHDVTLRQNPRKKGSALYGGYETTCSFSWKLKNPADRVLTADIKFPLPASGAMYDELTATLDGNDVLPLMQIRNSSLCLTRELQSNEVFNLTISFKSRGMSQWYLQVREQREIRDFTLALSLPDLPQSRLNYPEGCMTPTDIKATPDGLGSLLTYRLDHALSSKGMGITLPTLPQPGATTSAILGVAEQSWLLIFALLVLGLTIAGVSHSVLLSLLFSAAAALGYGLLGDFSDLLFGFWGTAALILLPLFLLLSQLIRTLITGFAGRLMSLQLLVYGILLPCAAGLDSDRQSLYLNLSAAAFLGFIAWQLVKSLRAETPPTPAPA